MTPHQVQRVRSSFALVAPVAEQAARMFYTRLFNADPAIAPLFKAGDMAAQGERLMQMIGAAVSLLDKPDQLMPVLQRLGARHAGYGVLASHYDTVGGALLHTLADALGDGFDEDTCDAWCEMYSTVSRTMIAAADAANAASVAAAGTACSPADAVAA